MGIKKGKGRLGEKDYKDYKREMAAKGELHALDTASGGLMGNRKLVKRSTAPKQAKKLYKAYDSAFLPGIPNGNTHSIGRRVAAFIQTWQDRNRSNNGTKLNP
jgi:hypothetical protein